MVVAGSSRKIRLAGKTAATATQAITATNPRTTRLAANTPDGNTKNPNDWLRSLRKE
jgi:hypothetical protein